ncbi:MAG: HAD-IIB family hydrolase [Lachnospiraceae bacterium]|nr:HAD-IIB family hydrolase [Lachnospiraceae bacterium]
MKLLFFDIDGTLWDWKNMIPESTQKAIRLVRESGNLAFINSGRTRGFIQNKDLLGIGFDGIVSGCGTMIEYGNEVIFSHEISADLAEKAVKSLRRCGWKPVLEGREYLYMDEEEFADDWYGQKLRRELGERLKPISSEWGRWEIQKMSCNTSDEKTDECIRELGEDFEFIRHDLPVCEIVPRPYSKGSGIRFLCDRLGVSPEDTYAFGDSVNDRAMMLAAGTAIVMGNGSEQAKKLADHVTDPLEEDGIWNACVHFRLFD